MDKVPTPSSLGFKFPAEWHPHRATWLSWPHNLETWPKEKIEKIYKPYCEFIKTISLSEEVCINVENATMELEAMKYLSEIVTDFSRIKFYYHPTNDAWCRDHGPAFVINENQKAIVNWGYNAWGGKYPPFDLDNQIPLKIAASLKLKTFTPGIIMEGGSVEFNSQGIMLTTTNCLLNENRNPELSKEQIEVYLKDFYGAKEIWWLGDGIIGDDTDGHIDDITRFVNDSTVVTVVEKNEADINHLPLLENLETLKGFTLPNGEKLNIIELPMPKPVFCDGLRLPASYANFCITNGHVIVPTFRDKTNDPIALEILQSAFKDRKIVGIDSTDIIWGLGSFHCLSQQEPKLN